MGEMLQAQSSMPSSARPSSSSPNVLVQRKKRCACGGTPGLDGECAQCRGKRLQRRHARGAGLSTVPPIVHEALRSSGRPLDPPTRTFMRSRFGHDFGRVRVHTDSKAAESARAVDALAYTVGQDVVFGARQYAPGEREGRELLAHELTHVIQQREGATPQRSSAISQPNDPTEMEAESVARRVVDGSPAPAIASFGVGNVLQRQEARDEKPRAGEQVEPPMTRAEEVERSVVSPGEIAVSVQPPVVSLTTSP